MDSVTRCKIVTDEDAPGMSIRWSGACKDGLASGNGTLVWSQQGKVLATYNGQMKAGNVEGNGKLLIPGYATMQGNFLDGSLNGQGAMYFENGGKTVGNFVNGQFLNLDAKYLPLLKKEIVALKDSTRIYDAGNPGTELFYYLLKPEGTVKAVLILFPSTGESVENVISCNRELMQLSYNAHIATAVVSANYNNSLDSDAQAMRFFETVFVALVTKYKLPRDKFILSGLSLGGENALHYTELSRNNRYDTYVKPIAVIGVDPPVDMNNLYHNAKSMKEEYEREGDSLAESKKVALAEDRFLIDEFHKLYGGSPEQFPQRYIDGSEFSRDQEDGGNAKFLIHVPVRLYCDPDILWQLKYKGRDYYHMNAADLSAMTSFLMKKGNKQVEFIPALGKGFRVDGTRHPHSWSIVDPKDCVEWMLGIAGR
ncbi:hypothetical protein DN068_04960 [Taibaiella soli]|uniref:Uncharacterized protein n=2 Tax=Taibaiella soli TaxID=1649169 RepID=A0A2W2AEY8_9BACT|nr:hypothetical protein DN068_04960 [Taibaiella soli]